MVKLLVFAILLASSPTNALVERLFQAEKTCYAGCLSNYATNTANLDACKKGCDSELHKDCANQCNSFSNDEQLRSSCHVGCTLSSSVDTNIPSQPVINVDPVQEIKDTGIVQPVNPEVERPRSIILIRLRQRPSIDMPSVQNFFNSDPAQFFNNIIKQFQEKANDFEQTVRKSFEQNLKDLPKQSEFPSIAEFAKNIPIIRLPANVRLDSSSESSEETPDKRPLIDEFKHIIQHPREHQQYLRARTQPINNRVQQFFTDVRTEWNDLVRKQPKIPIWIFLGILLSSSAILWYMVMSLCRHTPSRDALSIRAQELIFHPHEYDVYEKEKIQPDDDIAESLPIKVKLTNI